MYSIYYNEKKANGSIVNHHGTACFSGMGYNSDSIVSVMYHAFIDDSLTNEVVEYYFGFLHKLFGKDRFTYSFVPNEHVKNNVDFILDTKGLSNKQKLLFLTAARYVDEFSEIVLDMWNKRETFKTDDDAFSHFQLIHHLHMDRKFPIRKHGGNMSGHGLMYPYGKKFSPLTITEFQENIQNTETTNVHSFFNGGQPKPIVIPPEPPKTMADIWADYLVKEEEIKAIPQPVEIAVDIVKEM